MCSQEALTPFADITDATGSAILDFERAMETEHCSKGGCDFVFTTTNYQVTTTPRTEWRVVQGGPGAAIEEVNMSHGRVIQDIDELAAKPIARESGLIRAEVVGVVLYTGPMVSRPSSRRRAVSAMWRPPQTFFSAARRVKGGEG